MLVLLRAAVIAFLGREEGALLGHCGPDAPTAGRCGRNARTPTESEGHTAANAAQTAALPVAGMPALLPVPVRTFNKMRKLDSSEVLLAPPSGGCETDFVRSF